MRFLAVGLFALIAVASASVHPLLQYKEGQRYFIAPDREGKPHVVDLLAEDVDSRFTASTDVVFYLYTRSNPTTGYVLKNGDVSSLTASNFVKTKATKIIAHGWNSDGNSEVNTLIRDSFLAVLDVNVIVVDWGKGANGLYTTAVNNVPLVAAWTANLIDWLVSQGVSISQFHVMGHSLGGHICGQTCRRVTRGTVPYATAFDPAGPSWGSGTDRIRATDAAYVEVIHTDAGSLGLTDAVGHNDFYPNGGSSMPGCGIINVGCSHSMSYVYFADSLDHQGFMANQCATVSEATGNKCSNLSQLYMGGSKPKASRGIFRLTTNSKKPYYQG